MTPPSLLQEAQQYLQAREVESQSAYLDRINDMVEGFRMSTWDDARDLNSDWNQAYDDLQRAEQATLCQHATAQRSHEAQRCGCCWTISTYIRLTTPKENTHD